MVADIAKSRRRLARRLLYEEWTVTGRPNDGSANYLGLKPVLAPRTS